MKGLPGFVVASLLGISEGTARRWAKAGKLAAIGHARAGRRGHRTAVYSVASVAALYGPNLPRAIAQAEPIAEMLTLLAPPPAGPVH